MQLAIVSKAISAVALRSAGAPGEHHHVNRGNISDALPDAVTGYLFNGPWSRIGGVARKVILEEISIFFAISNICRCLRRPI